MQYNGYFVVEDDNDETANVNRDNYVIELLEEGTNSTTNSVTYFEEEFMPDDESDIGENLNTREDERRSDLNKWSFSSFIPIEGYKASKLGRSEMIMITLIALVI